MRTKDTLHDLILLECQAYRAGYWGDEQAILMANRQLDRLMPAFLARINQGDKAREALQQLAEAVGPDLLMRATFGEVTDTERAIAEILGKYFEDPQP